MVCGALLSLGIVLYRGLSPWMVGALLLLGLLVLYSVTVATKLVIGQERVVNYHHQAIFLGAAAGLFWLSKQPILPYLDAAALGLGMTIAWGRVGCLMNGCCHGRPHRWGVAYGPEHADCGFPSYLLGVRLFPIQGVEALWTLGAVAFATYSVLSGQAAGLAFATYAVLYASGRFFIELHRGDPRRPYVGGLSEAQWLSLIVPGAIVGMQWYGLLPSRTWHGMAWMALLASALFVALARSIRETPRHRLLHPAHVQEVAETLDTLSAPEDDPAALRPGVIPVHIETTSLGVQISRGQASTTVGGMPYYALSSENRAMSEAGARSLATLIQQLRHPSGVTELIRANDGVFHFLIGSPRPRKGLPTVVASMSGNGKPPEDVDLAAELQQEITAGLLCAHNRLNSGIVKGLEAASSVYALAELLEERGLINRSELEERQRSVREKLERQFIDEGMAVTVQDPDVDKYAFNDEVKIDCASRIELCKASCCRLHFPLSKQDLLEGIVRWNLRLPYLIAQGDDGYCVHLDKGGGCGCSIYRRRPLPCRAYDCRNDKRIWLDFERRIPQPALGRPDWPGCVTAAERAEETRETGETTP
jgi:Fe-S-cluster containining protein